MNQEPFSEPPPQPGQEVRWRHPRRAFALGWFAVYGPGPFEFVGLVDPDDQETLRCYLIKTASGEKEIDARWVGPIREGTGK